jgi:hypothetical protein
MKSVAFASGNDSAALSDPSRGRACYSARVDALYLIVACVAELTGDDGS